MWNSTLVCWISLSYELTLFITESKIVKNNYFNYIIIFWFNLVNHSYKLLHTGAVMIKLWEGLERWYYSTIILNCIEKNPPNNYLYWKIVLFVKYFFKINIHDFYISYFADFLYKNIDISKLSKLDHL